MYVSTNEGMVKYDGVEGNDIWRLCERVCLCLCLCLGIGPPHREAHEKSTPYSYM